MARARSSMPGGATGAADMAGATLSDSGAAAAAGAGASDGETDASGVVGRAGSIGLVAPSEAYVQSQARHSAAGGISRWLSADRVDARTGAGVGMRTGAGGMTLAGVEPARV